jgi:3-hydroxyisobutyrate dehydrogenase
MKTMSTEANLASIGFVGLGTMGTPMALRLLRGGVPLIVWNRTTANMIPLVEAGATSADDLGYVFANCGIVILMLSDEAATDQVVGMGSADFRTRMAGRLVVSMGMVSPTYSAALNAEIRATGGRYVEAPISGSRKQAEAGNLVAMVAGELKDTAALEPLMEAMCSAVFQCGGIPGALRMKLAVNVFLITLVTGLAEAVHFAARQGLDLERLLAILDAGPMASEVSRIKGAKLVRQDFLRQAGISGRCHPGNRKSNEVTTALAFSHVLCGKHLARANHFNERIEF